MTTLDWQDRPLREWRANARAERDRARDDLAAVWDQATDDLEKMVAEWDRTPLDLQAAAAESGYTVQGLYTMIRRGALRNVGRRNFPRVLRGDLPRKPRRTPLPKRDDDGKG